MKPNSLTIAPGCIAQAGQVLAQNHIGGKLLYVTDPQVDSLFGGVLRLQLERIGRVKEEPVTYNTIAYAMDVAERVLATDIDCIVAMGGGKVLDVCKYAAYISKRPLLSIPTTAANDGVASPIAVLKRQDGKPKSLGCAMPSMLLVDTDIICKSPPALVRAGIGDTVSNYTALRDWRLACARGRDTMNGYAYLMSQNSLDALMTTRFDELGPRFIEVLVNSLVLSGIAMDFAGSSRPVSGSEHLFSHALDYFSEKENLHGIQVALGTVAVLKLTGADYQDILRYLRKFDVDISPAHLGISADTFVYCLQNARSMRTDRYTCLDEADLDRGRLETLYHELVEELA